jgi:hypothetical protein
MAIAKSLATKKARGAYKTELGKKAFAHLAKLGAELYRKEFGARNDRWNLMFPIADRRLVGTKLERWFASEYKAGAFESLLPKKYQKGATKKQTCVAMAGTLGADARAIMRLLGPSKVCNQSTLLKVYGGLGFAQIVNGLNELVAYDLVAETTRQGARAWKLNACGKSVLRLVKKG